MNNSTTVMKPQNNGTVKAKATLANAIKPAAAKTIDIMDIPGIKILEDLPENSPIRTELEMALGLWPRYASEQLLDAVYIESNPESEYYGKMCGIISSDRVHTDTPGFFQLVLQWPAYQRDQMVAKLSISFKRNPNTLQLTQLSTGGGINAPQDGSTFMSLNSQYYSVDDLFNYGYINAEHEEFVFKHCFEQQGVTGAESRLYLLPVDGEKGDIIFVLRPTVVPKNASKDSGITTTKKPGEAANLEISVIAFNNAGVLSQKRQSLVGTPTRASRTYSELQALYGGGNNITAVPVARLAVPQHINGVTPQDFADLVADEPSY